MPDEPASRTRTKLTMTVLAALSVAVTVLGNAAAAFWTAIITGAIGSLVGGVGANLLTKLINMIPGF